MKRQTRWLAGLAMALLLSAAISVPARALPFSGITIFGDSFSDTGNVFLATGGAIPQPPYFGGRFSEGPVWVEHLAAGIGHPSQSGPSLLGGNNYAFGSARTGANPADAVPGVLAQVGGLWVPNLMGGPADPNMLFVVSGGSNDMRDARSVPGGDATSRQAAAQAAANNLITSLGVLAGNGAKEVLITNIPDLGATPEAVGLGLAAASSDAAARLNALMPTVLAAGASFGLNMHFLDLAALFADVRDDALNNGGALYGIINIFTPCGPFQGSIGISCSVSLYSDALHPSARAHILIGQAALDLLEGDVPSAIPAPSAIVLLGSGLIGLAVARRRRSLPH